jgi:hypothetical protein
MVEPSVDAPFVTMKLVHDHKREWAETSREIRINKTIFFIDQIVLIV